MHYDRTTSLLDDRTNEDMRDMYEGELTECHARDCEQGYVEYEHAPASWYSPADIRHRKCEACHGEGVINLKWEAEGYYEPNFSESDEPDVMGEADIRRRIG